MLIKANLQINKKKFIKDFFSSDKMHSSASEISDPIQLLGSQKELFKYLQNQEAQYDIDYAGLKAISIKIKETQLIHSSTYSFQQLVKSSESYQSIINYLRAYLRRIRELNHSLQDEFERNSLLDSRTVSNFSNPPSSARKSSRMTDALEKFVVNYRETEYLARELAELVPQFRKEEDSYTGEEQPNNKKDAHRWAENLDFELKCLCSEINKIEDCKVKAKAKEKVIIEYENNEPLQLLRRIHLNYSSLKQCFIQHSQTIDDLIELNLKEYNGVKVEKLMADSPKVSSTTSTVRVFSKDTSMSLNMMMDQKEPAEFQMHIEQIAIADQPPHSRYENNLAAAQVQRVIPITQKEKSEAGPCLCNIF